MKKVTAIILALILVINITCITYAEEELPVQEEIIEDYVNTRKVDVILSINAAGTATVSISCIGYTGTTHISASTYLERWTGSAWTRVSINGTSQIDDDVYGSYLAKTYTTTVASGTYRATSVFTVTRGTDETITVRSNQATH
ncbi:MAG: hypothetical protein IJK24_05520 [Oscillospiraceae bacterium]|nr:hypothetical protein [Oscillospiraceae bacterium]